MQQSKITMLTARKNNEINPVSLSNNKEVTGYSWKSIHHMYIVPA